MNKKMTGTDKLLALAIGISLLATILHTTLPAIICTVVHIAVTALISWVHLKRNSAGNMSQTQLIPAET